MSCRKVLRMFVLVLLVLFIFAGCSSDEENPIAPTPKSNPPKFNLQEIAFPQKMVNSTDEMAQRAISLVDDAMSFEGTGCVFDPPEGAEVLAETQTAWEYSWQDAGLTKRLAIILISEQHKWQQFFTGTADGKTYDNWRYMDAAQKTDQSMGHVYLYKAVTTQIGQEWSWHTLDNGNYIFKVQNYGESPAKIEITFEPGNAGKIESYKAGTTGALVYDLVITWNANGSGSWRTYQNGAPVDNGTWE
ncbi:hypothetical protein JW998_03820 [candidate division KSB1 bacterium]|nr:hypothetical protein [candidate division KSB1 bacterium]